MTADDAGIITSGADVGGCGQQILDAATRLALGCTDDPQHAKAAEPAAPRFWQQNREFVR